MVWDWVVADWRKVDIWQSYLISSGILVVCWWIFVVNGANRVLGAVLTPVVALAVYRTIRAFRLRNRG
jgi:hypothetical protein